MRERERQTDRQKKREIERDREKQTDRQIERDKERQRETKRGRERKEISFGWEQQLARMTRQQFTLTTLTE